MRSAYISSVLTLALLTGCASEGYKTAEKANMSLADTKTELLQDKAQLKKTVDTLNDLVYHPQADLRPQFTAFSNAVDELDKDAAGTRKSTDDAIKLRADYLAQWRSETLQNPDSDLRQRALKRISETEKRYDAVNAKMAAVNTSFDPLLVDLKAIRDYISTDLTSNGIKSISDRATSAKNNSITVDKNINAAVNEIDGTTEELAPLSSPTTNKSDENNNNNNSNGMHDMNKM
ncbi:MAG: DUF2959 family protein [Tepidisphaeraceae bacterium]